MPKWEMRTLEKWKQVFTNADPFPPLFVFLSPRSSQKKKKSGMKEKQQALNCVIDKKQKQSFGVNAVYSWGHYLYFIFYNKT